MSINSEEVKVIDIGSHYKFTPEMTTEYLPGGIYTPSYDGNGEFILEKMYSSADGSTEDIEEVEMIETDNGVKFFLDGVEVDRIEDGQLEPISKKLGMSEEEVKKIVSTSEWISLADVPAASPGEVPGPNSGEIEENVSYDVDWVNSSYFKMEDYNPGLEEADKNINSFLEKEDIYKNNGIDYRRSILFYGPPGTGKTQYIINKSKRLAKKVDAVVVRIESYSELEAFTRAGKNELERSIPERLKIIVVEEISDFFETKNYQLMISNMLDSSQLRNNIIFLATTNYPEKIPENIIDRPSRLDLLIDVHHKDNKDSYLFDWYEHLMDEKFPDGERKAQWVNEARDRFSPAYLKELFIYSKVLNTSIENSYNKLRNRQKTIKNNFSRKGSTGFLA